MTRKPAWKNLEAKRGKSGTVAGIFVVLVLLGFLAFGYVSKLHIKTNSDTGSRASANTYLAMLGTEPSSLFAFQKDTGKVTIFTMDDQKRVPGGAGAENLIKIGDLKSLGDGRAFLNSMTLAFRAKISNYVLFKNTEVAKIENLKKQFAKFTSYWTPVAIILGGAERGNIKNINITRIEAIRLWWQLKSVRTENIKITDLGENNIEKSAADGKKVLGVDESFLNSSIQSMTQSDDVVGERLKVIVNNPGKNRLLSQLAAGFVNNSGADLREVREDGAVVGKTVIFTDQPSSKTARNLAKIFDCDIKRLEQSQDQNTVLVVLGSDFGNTYLQ